jgi:L-ascorbate metabolism protein UlaG (beta-lactamase superfamily)
LASLKITHIGHAAFRFESEAGTVIYLDPWIEGNPSADMTVADIDRADIVVVTHGHMDHIGDSIAICMATGATFIGSYELQLFAEANGLALASNAPMPVGIGGTQKIKDVAITATPAHHSASMSMPGTPPHPNGMAFHPDGGVSGMVLAFDNGITVYDSSDTGVFSDMQLISQMYGPQIAILPTGGVYTMGLREAARAAGFIRPEILIPCHYGEQVGQPCDIDALAAAVAVLAPATDVVTLEAKATLTYTASSHEIAR